MNNFQRKNSISNTHVGNAFEDMVYDFFSREIDGLRKAFSINIGIDKKKPHNFDLGSKEEKVIIECKSHTWTSSKNVPSAKMTTWDQAMLYFLLAPSSYRKIFVVKKDYSEKHNGTLAQYYMRTHYHVIPLDVEFYELNESTKEITRLKN